MEPIQQVFLDEKVTQGLTWTKFSKRIRATPLTVSKYHRAGLRCGPVRLFVAAPRPEVAAHLRTRRPIDLPHRDLEKKSQFYFNWLQLF